MTGSEARARELAAGFRADHHLGLAPIKDVFELVHTAVAVDVMSLAADEAEHGLTMTDPATGVVVIAVATTPHPMRQRSSVAHELGHVVAGDLDRPEPFQPGRRTQEEVQANAFARHLLLPVAAVQERLHGLDRPVAEADLSALVQEYELSPQMAAIQMRDAGAIDAATCQSWSAWSAPRLATTFGWFSQYRVLSQTSRTPRAPQALARRAVEGYRRGSLGLTELSTWFGPDASEQVADLPAPSGPPEDADPTVDWEDDWGADEPLFPTPVQGDS